MKFKLNFKAVIVILFGIFCVYAYFRLISPYLDVGGNSTLVSSDIFSRKIIAINGEKYSYWTNNVINPKKIVVALPPSTATGDYFGKYAEAFSKNVLIIAPDYPGRGQTTEIKAFDTVPLMSYRIGILLKKLVGTKKFDIIAPSFGGMIGTKLAVDGNFSIDKLFLIGTGEFFAPDQKLMYKALFYPATVSEKMRQRYVGLLTGENVFNNLQSSNVGDLLEQWLMTINYKIDTSHISEVPTVIVSFKKDNIIQPGSKEKLQQVFVNSEVLNLDLPHVSSSFFDPTLLEIIKNNL